jgi:hypothetical protein
VPCGIGSWGGQCLSTGGYVKGRPIRRRHPVLGSAQRPFVLATLIGSFHRGDRNFSVSVDGKAVTIRQQGFQHFYVLNSEYYRQSLSEGTIKRLYGNFRDLLVHNAALAPEHVLISIPTLAAAFPVVEGRQLVNIDGLLGISVPAVKLFLERIPVLVPGSSQEANIRKKR